MKTVIFDASVIAKWFCEEGEPHFELAQRILKDWTQGAFRVVEPDLAIAELANVLLVGKGWNVKQVVAAMKKFLEPKPEFVQSETIWEESINIAHDNTITVYDSAYLAVAEQTDGVLVSDDEKRHGHIKSRRVVMLSAWRG
jgi:predicted nucleic acid-binding protein